MKIVQILPLLSLSLLPGIQAYAAAPAAPAPEPTRIIVEAAEMHGVAQDKFGPGEGWQVGRWGKDLYQNMTFGGVWSSRLRNAMTDAGTNDASVYSDIDVPVDGTYKVWVKYECPPFFNYPFGIRISGPGGGQPLFDKVYGLLASPKDYCFTDALTSGSLFWSWGIDHDTAEGYEVQLPKGHYRLTMYKAKGPDPIGARSVDTIMLTTDLSVLSAPHLPRYPLLDELRRANHVYFRFHNLSAAPIRIKWNHWNHRYPDFYAPSYRDLVKFYDADGNPLPSNVTGDWPDPIPAKGVSVWYDLGPTMNTESTSPYDITASYSGTPAASPADQPSFSVDIATQPNSKQVVKSFELGAGEPELTFLVQPDLTSRDGKDYTKKTVDIYRDVADELNKQPKIGPTPKLIRIFAETGGPSPSTGLTWDFDAAQAFREALGINTIEGNRMDKKYIDTVVQDRSKDVPVLPRTLAYHHSQDVPAMVKEVKDKGLQDNFYYLSYGDEISLPPIDIKDAAMLAAFRDFVKAHGDTPQTLGLDNWDQVKPLSALSTAAAMKVGVVPEGATSSAPAIDKLKPLYWYSTQFRGLQETEALAAKTKELKEGLGDQVQATANLGSITPFYWMDQATFIDSFKRKAMSLAWSEDYTYCQPEASRLAEDFEAAYLRKGASYNDTPMMFYCMPHFPGIPADRLLQDAVMLWGQNVKDIDFFNAAPDIWATENYVAYRGGLPTWQAIRTISGMAGNVEADLVPARPDPTPVAMLISESSDLWEVDGGSQWDIKPGSTTSNVSQEERKNIWYALRLAGYQVDIVTEDDVKDGLLDRYKAVYVCGQNLQREAAQKLAAWERNGGVVIGTAGAARKDEFDRPMTILDDAFGRGAQKSYHRFQGPLRAKLELLFEKPLDHTTLDTGSMDVLCSKETFTPTAGAKVLSRYASDNSPAWISVNDGKGAGYYTGTLPGESFVQKGLPVVPEGKGGEESNSSQFEPVIFDQASREMILKPLSDHNILPTVRIDHRSVVASRLSSPRSTVLAVTNLAFNADGELKNLKIDVSDIAGKPARVYSAFYPKGIPFTFDNHELSITVPALNAADVLVIVR